MSDSTLYYGGFYNDNTKENLQKYIIPAMIGNLSFFILNIVDGMFVGNGVGADAASVPIVCGALPKYCLNYVFAASTAVIAAYLFSTKRTQYAIPVNVCVLCLTLAASTFFRLSSVMTLWVLYYISEFDEDQTHQDLCRQSFHAKQTINTAISGLAKNGFVELIPIPGTRNHKKIHLTPKGLELVERTTRHLKTTEENAYGKLSEEELRAYLESAGKLNAYLRE